MSKNWQILPKEFHIMWIKYPLYILEFVLGRWLE